MFAPRYKGGMQHHAPSSAEVTMIDARGSAHHHSKPFRIAQQPSRRADHSKREKEDPPPRAVRAAAVSGGGTSSRDGTGSTGNVRLIWKDGLDMRRAPLPRPGSAPSSHRQAGGGCTSAGTAVPPRPGSAAACVQTSTLLGGTFPAGNHVRGSAAVVTTVGLVRHCELGTTRFRSAPALVQQSGRGLPQPQEPLPNPQAHPPSFAFVSQIPINVAHRHRKAPMFLFM